MIGQPTLAFMEREEVNGLCERVIGAFFEVSNGLGAGFLEKVYEKALVQELALMGIGVRTQVPFSVFYKGLCVGQYLADLVVEGSLLVELKCVERLAGEHSAQCMNYLKASGIGVCLLVNFQKPRVEWRRIVVGF
jgi:GxxExxY protein